MNRNNYHRNTQPNRAPMIMGVIMMGLIWLINVMHRDSIDASETMILMNKECARMDSVCQTRSQEADSLRQIVNWYKDQEDKRKKAEKAYFTKRPRTVVKYDSIKE